MKWRALILRVVLELVVSTVAVFAVEGVWLLTSHEHAPLFILVAGSFVAVGMFSSRWDRLGEKR